MWEIFWVLLELSEEFLQMTMEMVAEQHSSLPIMLVAQLPAALPPLLPAALLLPPFGVLGFC
jgi:hypothetical protein